MAFNSDSLGAGERHVGKGCGIVSVSQPTSTLHAAPEDAHGYARAHTHTHTHTHTQSSHLREWPAVKVGLTGTKMLVVSRQPPRTAFTSSANLQGLVLSFTGLETGSCQSPEDEDARSLTQTNTHRGLVSKPVVSVLICSESSECQVACMSGPD